MTVQSTQHTRLIRGTRVVFHGGAQGTVIDFPDDNRVRVAYTTGGVTIRDEHDVRTRAEALRHWHHMTTQLARDLDDVGLQDAMEQAAVFVERAAQQADAADAVRGLA